MINYQCCHKTKARNTTWQGSIRVLHQRGEIFELALTGRGSYFHVIVGPQTNGYFICIPNYNVGSELAGYEDVFWNKEQLSGLIGVIDATTVATGLSCMNKLLQKG